MAAMRLCKAKLAESEDCQLCKAHGMTAVGTLVHRLFECPYVEARAAKSRPDRINQEWERRGRSGGGAIRVGENAMEWERSLVQGTRVEERRVSGWFE